MSAGRDYDQNQAKVVSDKTRLQGDEASLASLQASAANPGATYTSLPQVGGIIREDKPVYSLSDEPVPLLYGAIAAYRAFYVGMSDGADVGQLTHDLISLGYGAGLTESDQYSAATATAVERWRPPLACRRPARSCSAVLSSSLVRSGSPRSRLLSGSPSGMVEAVAVGAPQC